MRFPVDPLTIAESYALRGNFDKFIHQCQDLSNQQEIDTELLLKVAALMQSYGFLTEAQATYRKALSLSAPEERVLANQANIYLESLEHEKAIELYKGLVERNPDVASIRRNQLLLLEYAKSPSPQHRLGAAKEWAQWAISKAGGEIERPRPNPYSIRPLRVGYVSPDLGAHTVGYFLKDVLQHHNAKKVQVFCYSARALDDDVNKAIQRSSEYKDVSQLSDVQLCKLIKQDAIDVLVDLSGHTAGSRLTVFALRPAPVLVSWLGYFATTGLPYIDAVLLDQWHAPVGMEEQFVEPIVRLQGGRLCFNPVEFAPTVSDPPCVSRGFVTFGSFNNTSKYNNEVFDAWARILLSVPESRLILKWRTFNDESLKHKIKAAFIDRGITEDRVELRGPSFHVDMLGEYADIDIALDPFPFTGGMTSCEALWMGVPIVTLAQDRVVSRQTHAILNQIGIAELSADNVDDYVSIAVALAKDRDKLQTLRSTMRNRMQNSSLMDLPGFTRNLEDTLINLFNQKQNKTMTTIKIDDKEYDFDKLTDEAKAQFVSLQFCDQELQRLQAHAAALQTARMAYAKALNEALNPLENMGEKVTFN